jgi:hypothetical protein
VGLFSWVGISVLVEKDVGEEGVSVAGDIVGGTAVVGTGDGGGGVLVGISAVSEAQETATSASSKTMTIEESMGNLANKVIPSLR